MSRQINQLSKFQFHVIDFSSVYKFAITFLPMPLPRVWNILLHTVPFCKPPKCFGPRACFCAKVCWCILDTIVPSFYAVLLASLPCPAPVHISAPLLLLPSSARKKTSLIANCQLSEYVAVIRAERSKDKMVRAIILSHFVLGILQRWL